MNREQRRRPSGIGGMAVDAGRGDVQCDVIRIGGVVVIFLVAAHAGVGRVVIIAVGVTVVAVGGCMSPR